MAVQGWIAIYSFRQTASYKVIFLNINFLDYHFCPHMFWTNTAINSFRDIPSHNSDCYSILAKMRFRPIVTDADCYKCRFRASLNKLLPSPQFISPISVCWVKPCKLIWSICQLNRVLLFSRRDVIKMSFSIRCSLCYKNIKWDAY